MRDAMRLPGLGSISKNLALLVVVAVLPALLILLSAGMEQRRHSIFAARQNVLFLTHSMVEVQKRVTSSTKQTLSTLALTTAIQSMDAGASSAIFQAVLERNPDYLNISLADLDGRLLASGRPFAATNLADRKHVREALTRLDFAVGEYVVTRVGGADPAFAFAYPVLDSDGKPRGVLTATLGLDHFAGLYDVAGLPADSFLAVTDHQGIRLFYHPRKEKTNPLGRPINPAVWEVAGKVSDSGIFLHPGSDGVRRIFAFENVRLGPQEEPYAVMWAGIPEEHILAAANKALVGNLLLMALAALLTLAVAWLVGKHTLVAPIKGLVAATQRVAQGNLEARTGLADQPGELGILARAFDEMATNLNRSQQTLREREGLIRAVLDNLPIGVAVNTIEPTVHFEYMNDNFPRHYRTSRAALAAPDAFWEAVYEDPDFREEIRSRVLADCASGNPDRMRWTELPLVRQGAETTYVSARNAPVHEKNLMISLVWDVTEQKKAALEHRRLQEQLAQAQKMESVGRLAGGVAHDFNNILSIILGYTQLALSKIDAADPLRKDLQEVETAALRSADLTRQLLAFARKQPVAPEVLNLNTTLAAMLTMLRRLIGEDVELVWRPREELWPVKMDVSQVDQIMVNICVNARDALAGVGTVTIATANVTLDRPACEGDLECQPGDYVMIMVSDNGSGMDQETMVNIFDPFFTTKGPGQGTGLGLATVFGIVKQNKGLITVDSEPGLGATFKVYLPRWAGPGRPAAARVDERAAAQGRGETILLVEDDPGVMHICRRMLASLGYQVISAGLPGEAIRLAEGYDGVIDLLVTDVIMPEMHGRDLAEALVAGHPGLKCLFMSGYTADIIASQGVVHEGVRFIEKPFSLADIARSVRQALDGQA
jgi:signal transduction histidine kinase/ActR/RegA family two-component response regulator